MKHGIKKVKFTGGQDSHQMVVKKLVHNFVRDGYITTTLKRAKVLRATIDRLSAKSQEGSPADVNYLRQFVQPSDMKKLAELVTVRSRESKSGYTTMVRLLPRASDQAAMVRVAWVPPSVAQVAVSPEEKKEQPRSEKKVPTAKKQSKKPLATKTKKTE